MVTQLSTGSGHIPYKQQLIETVNGNSESWNQSGYSKALFSPVNQMHVNTEPGQATSEISYLQFAIADLTQEEMDVA